MIIRDYGDEKNPIWVVMREPYAKDSEQGYLLSCGYGHNFKKTWKLSGASDPFITSINPELSVPYDWASQSLLFLTKINNYQPKIIVVLGDELLNTFVPYTKQKNVKASSLTKWAGSLLRSDLLTYDHYIIPSYEPDFVSSNWDYHEIQGFIDFGHVKEEIDYFNANNKLNPLPMRSIITNPTYDNLCDYLRWLVSEWSANRLSFVSSDIETIRPKKSTNYHTIGHPGYTYTISLAPSIKEAISFCFWDYPAEQAIKIWRLLNAVLSQVPQIGQNYFSFDSHHLEALGYRIYLSLCQDTLLRHHILWPGLPHKLQFQTRQYTREPYYKDEGKNWSSKQKHQLMRYNCLDAMVTYEIYLAQEGEFNDRPHLR